MDYNIKDFGVMDDAAHAAGSSTVYLIGDGTDQTIIKQVEGYIPGQPGQGEDEHNATLERMVIRKICGLDGLHAVTGTNDLPMRNSSAYGKGLTIPPASEGLPHPGNARIGGGACHDSAFTSAPIKASNDIPLQRADIPVWQRFLRRAHLSRGYADPEQPALRQCSGRCLSEGPPAVL